MNPLERDLDFIGQMHGAATTIQNYTKGGRARFMANRMAQDAVMRQLEILGEAARRVSEEFRDANTELPWRAMVALRNVLIHGYDSIDLDKVWDAVSITVNQTLPLLQRWLER